MFNHSCTVNRWGHNKLTLFSCGTGTMFDPSVSVCVHSHPTVCSIPPLPALPNPLKPLPPYPELPKRPGGSSGCSDAPSVGPLHTQAMTLPLIPFPCPPKPPTFPTTIPNIAPLPPTTSRPIISLPRACSNY